MAKKAKWKIVTAIFAVVAAGIVYCAFWAEEKESTVKYQTGEESNGTLTDVSYLESSMVKDSEPGKSGENGKNSGKSDGTAQEDTSDFIYVHVCGAVKNPAVYSLPEGSRVCDAIAKAGGLTENAADDYVNQARFLNDGERVYIPVKTELSNLSASQYAAGQPVASIGSSQGGNGIQIGSPEKFPVNINTAGVSELTTLPGIGESRAESIVAYRKTHGAFSKIEDIMKISGIKGAAYEKIKDKICTGNE